jgi:chemotaxis protein histidine kinase CheA
MDGRKLRPVAVLLLSAVVLFAAMPGVGALAQEDTPRAEVAIEALEAILTRLEEALVRLDEQEVPVLEEQLETIAALLEALIAQLEEGQDEDDGDLKRQIVKLDLLLHRLVNTLERLVARQDAATPPTAEARRAREAVESLRVWVNGYIDGLTASMRPDQAREFERLAGALLKALNEHVARIVHGAIERHEEPTKLEMLLERIQELVHRLDRFIARHFGRPAQPPRPRRSQP